MCVCGCLSDHAGCCYASFFGEVKVIFFELNFFLRMRIYCCCCGVYHFILLPKKPKSYHLNLVIFIHENWFFLSFLTNLSAYHAFISQRFNELKSFSISTFFRYRGGSLNCFHFVAMTKFLRVFLKMHFIFLISHTLINMIISSYNFPFQMNRFVMMKYMRNIRKWREFI